MNYSGEDGRVTLRRTTEGRGFDKEAFFLCQDAIIQSRTSSTVHVTRADVNPSLSPSGSRLYRYKIQVLASILLRTQNVLLNRQETSQNMYKV